MSFFFGNSSKQITKQEVDSVFQAINGKEESQQANIVNTLVLNEDEIHGYYKLNICDFFKDIYANVRPRGLEIVIKNMNPEKVESVDCWYLHTPLRDEDLDVEKLDQFSNKTQFTQSAKISNPQPYLTFCQTGEEGEIVDIDISQTTNINLLPDRMPFVSLGALIFQANRKQAGDIALEVTISLSYSIKKY